MKLSEKIDEMIRESNGIWPTNNDGSLITDNIDGKLVNMFIDGYEFALKGVKNVMEVCEVDIELDK